MAKSRPQEEEIQTFATNLREEWNVLTSNLYAHPYSANSHLQRSRFYLSKGFPDLACADAYRGLLLIDEIEDESGEYHDEATAELEQEQDVCQTADALAIELYIVLAQSLLDCGCLRSCWNFLKTALKRWPAHETLTRLSREVYEASADAKTHSGECIHTSRSPRSPRSPPPTFEPGSLPDAGRAPRILYPWNTHEADRYSPKTISALNELLHTVAPNLAVRTVELPLLSPSVDAASSPETITQLGLFATAPLAPGTPILRERSLLTAVAPLHSLHCDACLAPLPPLSSGVQTISCPHCPDVIFCSSECLQLAQASYHEALCSSGDADPEIHCLLKDPAPADAADTLYSLLLLRALAMAVTQSMHPLDVPDVKYIWGDYSPLKLLARETEQNHELKLDPATRTLPFSFTRCVAEPIRILYALNVDPFARLRELADPWIHATLMAKFRGTASGRVNERTGVPEAAAVQTCWCLANHSCAPNVEWRWIGGEMVLRVKEEKVNWGVGERKQDDGICAGEEILNHYCDIELPVQKRREWAAGALGGMCMCERCVWEAAEQNQSGIVD